jgi:hypothetical protein
LNQARLKEIREKAKSFVAAHPAPRTPLMEQPGLAAALKAWEPERPLPPIAFECEIDLSKDDLSLPAAEAE